MLTLQINLISMRVSLVSINCGVIIVGASIDVDAVSALMRSVNDVNFFCI